MSVSVESTHNGSGQPLHGSGPPLARPALPGGDTGSDLLDLPEAANGTECRLIAEVAILDSRSLHAFGAGSPARKQVKELLRHSLRSDLACHEARFLNRAMQTFRDRVLSRNRTRYIVGVLLGMIPLGGLALLANSLDEDAVQHLGMESALCCSWTVLFAGMGALCSVFTRLGTIDMCDETNALFIYLSGVFRPFTATIFAITIIQILRLNALSMNSSGAVRPDELHVHLYFLVAFLSGFSERFASDLIGRAERVVSAPVGAAPATGEPERPVNAGAAGPAVGQA